MDLTLVIMAAGIGSRYGAGIKQLAAAGPNGELIIDYSIHDALEAGFNKIVFIIRKDLEADFKEVIGDRIEKHCDVSYAFQERDALPAPFECPKARTKPWGTGQAILCCRDCVTGPFMIINADDYYGKEAFAKMRDFLLENGSESRKYCMAGYVLKNTISENGAVTRGVCLQSEDGMLMNIDETRGIHREPDGRIVSKFGQEIPEDSLVSMNMWGVTPDIFPVLEEGFTEFLREHDPEDDSSEYLLPEVIGEMLRKGRASVRVLPVNDKWFGITYKEDLPEVQKAFAELIEKGEYETPLDVL